MNITQPAKKGKQDYLHGKYTQWEFFYGLLNRSKVDPVPEILAILSEAEVAEFKEFILELSNVKSETEWIAINSPPDFGVEEVQNFVRYFNKGGE